MKHSILFMNGQQIWVVLAVPVLLSPIERTDICILHLLELLKISWNNSSLSLD